MHKTRLLLTFFLCIATIMLLVGCNILDNLVKDDGSSTPLGQFLNKAIERDADNKDVPVITSPQQGESTVKLFFADKSGEKLIEVNRTIPKTLSLAKETINQWLIGPAGGVSDSYPSVSPQTTLRGINIKNGIAIVDLSKEFLEPFGNISAETTLYGLVNTVSQFSTVQIVKIRVEGREIKNFRGIDLSDLRFRNDLVGFSAGPISQGQSTEQLTDLPQEDSKMAAESEEKDSPSLLNLFMN